MQNTYAFVCYPRGLVESEFESKPRSDAFTKPKMLQPPGGRHSNENNKGLNSWNEKRFMR